MKSNPDIFQSDDAVPSDAVMALFPGGAGDAIRAAIGMQESLAELNRERSLERLSPLRIGFGIHQFKHRILDRVRLARKSSATTVCEIMDGLPSEELAQKLRNVELFESSLHHGCCHPAMFTKRSARLKDQ
ncbi:MAG: hypothetical protein HS115_18860 [Spirochaetales bacterium]|nr:hypothetical protein [Spirochaetales bacterium]